MTSSSLQKGIDAAKAGQMEAALAHLKDAIVEEPENANVWVWLAAIIEDEDKQSIFLKKALEIEPGNRPAQRGLAFIERKKYIPPKPGEKLSDYTKPIGIFKTPTDAAADVIAANAEAEPEPATDSEAQTILESPAAESVRPVQPPKPVTTGKRKAWLDILFYGVTLIVFIVIGILIGTTLLEVDIPFLSKPTPVLAVLPPTEGVFLNDGDAYREMKLQMQEPTDESEIPVTTQSLPGIIINTQLINIDRVQLTNAENQLLLFETTPAENAITILRPQSELIPGRYCLMYTLNAEKNEALYWCLKVE